MKTLSTDIKELVFDSDEDTEAIMYITHDHANSSYIVSIPIYNFSWEVKDLKLDHILFMKFDFLSEERRKKISNVAKRLIDSFAN